MNPIKKKALSSLGYKFIPPEYISEGSDEYTIRNEQLGKNRHYRPLKAKEIEVFVKNGNSSDNWNEILIAEPFDPHLVKGCQFYGMVRIASLEACYLEFHDMPFPVGLYESTIIACDIGSNVSIRNVNLLSRYILEDGVILQNVNEMVSTDYAKFGNGILKDGEDEALRIWLETCNENGGRKVLPFNGMTTGDAWIWSRYKGRPGLQTRLKEMTQNHFSSRRGYYGVIGTRSVILHSRVIKDVRTGSDAYIKGANKLKNITINSRPESPSQIGEGVEMVNGIVGHGCHAFYGVKAVRFVMNDYSNLKYGARLINSVLGSNSTISCCEVLNSLIFPGHEQHHNSSFLCASTFLGQSNMASGATIGSNHNSRGNDGEIIAGRGFWPGLSTSLKHNCRFASFSLLVKGAYPAEIDNPFPFSLISNDEPRDRLLIRPAYWFLCNMFALARNSWKYRARDYRKEKVQNLVFDHLAPDTVGEIFEAMNKLRDLIEKGLHPGEREKGGHLLLMENSPPYLGAEGIENSRREVHILKPGEAYREYRRAVLSFAIGELAKQRVPLEDLLKGIQKREARENWLNVGGQLILQRRLDSLLGEVEEGKIHSWEEIHQFYKEEGKAYPEDLQAFAFASLGEIYHLENREPDLENLKDYIRESIEINQIYSERVFQSRAKDYSNPFRKMVYSDEAEMEAVLGKLEECPFIWEDQRLREKTKSQMEALLNS